MRPREVASASAYSASGSGVCYASVELQINANLFKVGANLFDLFGNLVRHGGAEALQRPQFDPEQQLEILVPATLLRLRTFWTSGVAPATP